MKNRALPRRMGLRAFFLGALMLGTQLPAKAGTGLEISFQKVEASSVVSWRPLPKPERGSWIPLPQAKLFAPEGHLLAFGTPSDFLVRLSGQEPPTSQDPPQPLKVRHWVEEQHVLGMTTGSQVAPRLVLYEGDPCPPCERLLAPVVAQSKARYGAKLEVVRVMVR